MNKIPEDELLNFIKTYNLCHFKKVNLIGAPNVGKKTLVSYIEHYSDNNFDFEIKENNKNKINENNDKKSLVESVKRMSIPYYDTKRLDINLYITSIQLDDIEYIKENLDTLLCNSECLIFMIDISSSDSFSLISELIPSLYQHMKKSLEYGNIPLFLISNKIDLEQNREVSGFEVKELIDNYEGLNTFEISLKLEKNAKDDNINEFIIRLCNTISDQDKKYCYCYDSLNLVKIREPMSVPNDSDILQHSENVLNFLLLGSQAVGKSSFAQRLFNNKFNDNTIVTLGIDVIRTISELYGSLVKIELWDTAGQERLRSIPKKYYSKGDGFFLLFDVTDRKTFEDISGWIKDIRTTRGNDETNFEQKTNDEVLVLMGNKIDNVQNRTVSKEEANELAEKYNVKYYEISCKSGINIYEVFCDVIFEASSKNRRESTNFVIDRRRSRIKSLVHPKKKKCC